MLGHIGINVPDLGQAKAYYDELLGLLDYEPFFSNDDEIAYLPAAGKRGTYLFFYLAQDVTPYSRHQPGLQHLAFMVRTRSAVKQAHERALRLGSESLHTPQEFPQYPPPYFAAFWLDPFGFMIEAVCHHDRD